VDTWPRAVAEEDTWEAGRLGLGRWVQPSVTETKGCLRFLKKRKEKTKKNWFVLVNWAFWAVVKKAYLPH